MAVQRIDRAADPRLDLYRDVRDADLLRRRGLFAAEGRLIVGRVLADPRLVVESVLVNDAALRDLAAPLAALDTGVPVLVCPTREFPALVGFDLHRGCLALVRRPPPTPISMLIADARTLLVLEAVANADNIGGIIRNAAAFAAGGLLLSPTCCDPLYRKAVRTSMGAALEVPFARCEDHEWVGLFGHLRDAGFTIVALTPRQPSETLDSFAARRQQIGAADRSNGSAGDDQPPRLALIFGAEGTGVSAAVEAAADCRVRIPTSDRVDSLNVAVAAGIVLSRLQPGSTVTAARSPAGRAFSQ